MANTLRFKRGLASGLPTGVAGEPLFTTDTFDLYIGTGAANQRYQKYIASGTTLQYLRGDGSLATFPTNIITGTGIAGQVAYWSGASTQTGSNNLFWDITNGRLGIGTNTPSATIHVIGQDSRFGGVASGLLSIYNASTRSGYFQANGGSDFRIVSDTDAMTFYVNGSERARILPTGFFGINTNNPLAILHAVGLEARFGGVSSALISLYNASTRSGFIQANAGVDFRIGSNTDAMTFYVGGSEAARFSTSRNFIINNASTDNGLRFQVTGDGYFSGNVAIGDISLRTRTNLTVWKNITGDPTSFGIYSRGTIQSSVTTEVNMFVSVTETQAASFTLGALKHFRAINAGFGAGSVVTNQFGFIAEAELVGATNNYGFYGNIASGTGRWNLFMNGSAANYLRGNTAINTTTIVDNGLTINQSVNGSNILLSLRNDAGNADNEVSIKMTAGSATAGEQGTILTHLRQGTGGGAFIIKTNPTLAGAPVERMRLDASGNLGLGTASPTSRLDVTQSGSTAGISVSGGTNPQMRATDGTITAKVQAITGLAAYIGTESNHQLRFIVNNSPIVNLFTTGNVSIASTSDTGEKLQVNGTMRVTGASTFGGLATISTSVYPTLAVISSNSIGCGMYLRATGTSGGYFTILSTASGAGQGAGKLVIVDELASATRFTMDSTGAATFSSSITAASGTIGTAATTGYSLVVGNSGANDLSGIRLTSGGTDNGYFITAYNAISKYASLQAGDNIAYRNIILNNLGGNVGIGMSPSYKLDVTGEARVSSAIAIGTTPDTNKPFKILKNINATVGINFENTSTSSLAFSAIQMGTDVTGGTKFTNLVYASSGVVANGVYNPDGTSLINNGGGGLNFLGTPTRFYTGGSNGVLRLYFDNEGTTQLNATSPTTSITDGYRQYSADVVAGNAAPHFRTENGGIIKLYQETTGVGNAIFSQGGGTSVLDDSTFDGYTLRQIVKALRNQGILA